MIVYTFFFVCQLLNTTLVSKLKCDNPCLFVFDILFSDKITENEKKVSYKY